MTTNQEGKHAAFRAIGGTSGTYNEDAIAAMVAEGASGTTFNEIMISWLQIRTGSSDDNINNLKQAFADAEGFDNWDAITTFTSNYFPLTISGLAAAFDASDSSTITLSGSDAVLWADKSGNGNDADNSVGTYQPEYVTGAINSLNVARYDGSNTALGEKLTVADDATIQNIFDGGGYVAMVFKITGTHPSNAGYIFCKGEGSGGGWNIAQADFDTVDSYKLTIYYNFSTASGWWQNTNFDITANTTYVVEIEYDNSSVANNPTITINGTSVAVTERSTPVGTRTSDATRRMGIGSREDATTERTMVGDLGEVLAYSTVPSTANKTAIREYLADKWGITL